MEESDMKLPKTAELLKQKINEKEFPEFACKNLITKNLFRKKSHIFGIFFNFLLTNC